MALGTPVRAPAPVQVASGTQGILANIASLQRLEQRVEHHRRHVDSQLARLDQRLREYINSAPSFNGKWADLQGHVDGLGETVQGLVKRVEQLSAHDVGVTELAPITVPEGIVPWRRDVETLDQRVSTLEDSVGLLQKAMVTKTVEVIEVEAPRQSGSDRTRSLRERTLLAQFGDTVQLRGLEQKQGMEEQLEDDDLDEDGYTVRQPLWRAFDFDDKRLDADGWNDRAVHAEFEDNHQDGNWPRSLDDEVAGAQQELIALGSRMRELENRLEVSEQVMSWAIKARRVHRIHRGLVDAEASSASDDDGFPGHHDEAIDANGLRAEVMQINFDLDVFGPRVEALERSLGGIGAAFDRVCQELAELQAKVQEVPDGTSSPNKQRPMGLEQSTDSTSEEVDT